MAIKIKGVIGYDVDRYVFADKLSRLSGDIEFEIDSPGGLVSAGFSIANAIRKYDRGKCTMHVVGQCSSMALYIAMCGDELPEFEPNAICVAHNPFTSVTGDYRDFEKQKNILEKMAILYAKPFVEKKLFSEKEIRQLMDEETYFIGEKDLLKLGKIRTNPECNGGGNIEDDEVIRVATVKEEMAKVEEIIRAAKPVDISEIEALVSDIDIPESKYQVSETSDQPQTQEPQAQAQEKKGNNTMADMTYEAEVKRRDALLELIDVDQEAVIDALKTGKDVTDPTFQAKILRAKINSNELAAMNNDNPPKVQPAEEIHAPENFSGKQISAEEKAKAKKEEFDKILAEVTSYM